MKMNVNLTKLISSAAAVLAVGSSAYAQQTVGSNTYGQQKAAAPTSASSCCFEQGYEICNDKFPAAYNAAARVDVQCSWDIYVTGSFLYWHADQDAMDLAYPYVSGDADGQVLMQKFSYKPGFKVGLGVNFDHDNWVGFVEYTWFHQKTDLKSTAAPEGSAWYMTSWFNDLYTPTAVSSNWKANFDILDATLSRPYYQGRKLTILPFAGLRGAWIRQSLKVDAAVTSTTGYYSRNHSHSWAVGALAGMQAHWLLGWGCRFEGDVSGSILYTRYSKVSFNEYDYAGLSYGSLNLHGFNTIRPMAGLTAGFGWGSYFDRQNYHLDLLATYDFNVLWGQNMMRYVATLANSTSGPAAEPADLHLQGLTVTARFDF
jgi:hypothetical protein